MQVCPAGLRSAVEALDRAEAGDRRAEALLEVHRVIKYQRQRLSEYSEHARAQLGGSLLLLMQRNAQQPYADVVQAHCTMLVSRPHLPCSTVAETAAGVQKCSRHTAEQIASQRQCTHDMCGADLTTKVYGWHVAQPSIACMPVTGLHMSMLIAYCQHASACTCVAWPMGLMLVLLDVNTAGCSQPFATSESDTGKADCGACDRALQHC